MTQAIKLTLSEKLAKTTISNAQTFGYYNVQELIQEAIRDKNFELEKKQAILALKNIPKRDVSFLTKKERQKIAKNLEHSSDMKYDLN